MTDVEHNASGAPDARYGSVLDAPEYLDTAPAHVFSKLVGALGPYRILEEADRFALAQLAELLAECRELKDDIKKNGMIISRRTGMGDTIRRANPAVELREKLAGRSFVLMRHFGMTPLARRGFTPDAGEQGDLLDEFGLS